MFQITAIADGNIVDVEDAADALPRQLAGEAHPKAGDGYLIIVRIPVRSSWSTLLRKSLA